MIIMIKHKKPHDSAIYLPVLCTSDWIAHKPASSLSPLHSDPRFSITLISLLGAQNSSGAVPRTPETPRHSPTLRDRPRGALFCIALSPGPLVFFGPFDACVLSVIWMSLCAFGGNRSSRSLCPFGIPEYTCYYYYSLNAVAAAPQVATMVAAGIRCQAREGPPQVLSSSPVRLQRVPACAARQGLHNADRQCRRPRQRR